MSDKRRMRTGGEELGPYTLDEIIRLERKGAFEEHTQFWSEAESRWKPMAALMLDFYPPRLSEMKEAGIRRVRILGTGSDCRYCTALAKRAYPIDDVPVLPPEQCECRPWCRVTVVGAE